MEKNIMTRLHKICKYTLLVICLMPITVLLAQDRLPASAVIMDQAQPAKRLPFLGRTRKVPILPIDLPKPFSDTIPNIIRDNGEPLHALWQRLSMTRLGVTLDSMRIVHIGDSHIRGHIFPQTTGGLLTEAFGPIAYKDFGINGATCKSYLKSGLLNKVAQIHPDMVIMSFGTNESHDRNYRSNVHEKQMDELLQAIRARMPHAPIIMTTPPGSYIRRYSRRRGRYYIVNTRTIKVANAIRDFAKTKHLALWDLYALAGNKEACINWNKAALMRHDHIHYYRDGYKLQGELFYDAIINTYNQNMAY